MKKDRITVLAGKTPRAVATVLTQHLRGYPPAQRSKRWGVIEGLVSREVVRPDKKKGSRNSKAWKALERQIAEAFGGKRVSRGADFGKEDVDVIVEDIPFLKIDGKYRNKHAHHTFMEEIIQKYCKDEDDVPVLVTKHKGQSSAYVTISLDFMEFLLDQYRASR